MKKIIKIVFLGAIVGFIGIQFFQPARTNPPVIQAETLEATADVPDEVRKILRRSCNDCHSHQTVYPWYAYVAPFSWQVVEHIEVGRDELNFSKWGTYSAKKKDRKLEEICEEVESGRMPHNQYLWIHRDAVLTEQDVELLCNWAKNEKVKTEKHQTEMKE